MSQYIKQGGCWGNWNQTTKKKYKKKFGQKKKKKKPTKQYVNL